MNESQEGSVSSYDARVELEWFPPRMPALRTRRLLTLVLRVRNSK